MTIRRIWPVLLLLAGCSFFSRTPNKFYSLERIAGPVVSAHGLPIAIDSFELPPDLDRREIVIRQADHKLEVRGAEQWSARLQPLALHTLAFDLASRLPEGMMILPGEAKPLAPVRSIDVVLEELAAGPDKVVVLDGRWVVRENGKPDVTRHERIAIDVPGLDSASVATGVSKAVATFADHIASQM
jgi:uncharacterized lipoprotein YmbA